MKFQFTYTLTRISEGDFRHILDTVPGSRPGRSVHVVRPDMVAAYPQGYAENGVLPPVDTPLHYKGSLVDPGETVTFTYAQWLRFHQIVALFFLGMSNREYESKKFAHYDGLPMMLLMNLKRSWLMGPQGANILHRDFINVESDDTEKDFLLYAASWDDVFPLMYMSLKENIKTTAIVYGGGFKLTD